MVRGGEEGKIRSFVLSWQMREAVQRAAEDEDALSELLQLLKEDDDSVKMRVLSALEEVVRDSENSVRVNVLKEGFPLFLDAIVRNESLASRALSVLARLIEGVPLPKRMINDLLGVLSNILLKGDNLLWIDIVDMVSKLQPPLPEETVGYVVPLLDSENPGARSVGIRLVLLLENPGEVGWSKILGVLGDLIRFGDPLVVGTALDSVMSILSSPYGVPMEYVVRMLYSPLKNITSSDHDAFIKGQAREVMSLLYGAVSNYYRSRPDDGRELAAKLMKEGLLEEAIFVAMAAGLAGVPSVGASEKLANMLANGTFPFPRFLRG
jgi:hypothetical protein